VRLGAFAVIFDAEGRVLVSHRRDADAWDLPGGGTERGETPWDAVVREVAEETGLEVKVEVLTGVYRKPAELVLVFRCWVSGGALRLTEEADAHDWRDPRALPANMSPNHRQRVLDALALSSAPALRVQPDYRANRPDARLDC
jgi:8-oxo-dGTP pyrophosphatase MutT (NUDIX family)